MEFMACSSFSFPHCDGHCLTYGELRTLAVKQDYIIPWYIKHVLDLRGCDRVPGLRLHSYARSRGLEVIDGFVSDSNTNRGRKLYRELCDNEDFVSVVVAYMRAKCIDEQRGVLLRKHIDKELRAELEALEDPILLFIANCQILMCQMIKEGCSTALDQTDPLTGKGKLRDTINAVSHMTLPHHVGPVLGHTIVNLWPSA